MTENKQSVLVTGGNGFIASHIVAQLIEAGYEVTTSVRSEDKAQRQLKANPSWKGKVHFGFVPDLMAAHPFDELYNKSYDFIVHTASPMVFVVNDIQKDLIDPAVQGTLELLQSAHKFGGSQLKRVVILGSAVSVMDSLEEEKGVARSTNYTEEDWNPVTAEVATERQSTVLGYNAGKTLAEKAAWQFMKENEPAFDLTVINPDVVIGPMLHHVAGPQAVNATNQFAIYSLMNDTYDRVESVIWPFYHFVDVRDVARAHLLSLTAPLASNKRILLISGRATPQLVANIIHERLPELRHRVPRGTPDQIYPTGVNPPTDWDVARSYEVFQDGWRYRPLEESVVDTVRDILRREEGWESTKGEGRG